MQNDIVTLRRVANNGIGDLDRDVLAQVLAAVVVAQQVRIEALEHEMNPTFPDGDGDDWWKP